MQNDPVEVVIYVAVNADGDVCFRDDRQDALDSLAEEYGPAPMAVYRLVGTFECPAEEVSAGTVTAGLNDTLSGTAEVQK